MYNRIHKFLSDKNLIYSVQFGFRKKYSTVHVLISLTENIRKNLDEGNIGCGIFVDLQKECLNILLMLLLVLLSMIFFIKGWTLHITVYLVLLLNGLNLSNKKQHVSINGYDSNLADVKFGFRQWPVLDPLFLIYINDLNQALKFCKMHHFCRWHNLLHFSL